MGFPGEEKGRGRERTRGGRERAEMSREHVRTERGSETEEEKVKETGSEREVRTDTEREMVIKSDTIERERRRNPETANTDATEMFDLSL